MLARSGEHRERRARTRACARASARSPLPTTSTSSSNGARHALIGPNGAARPRSSTCDRRARPTAPDPARRRRDYGPGPGDPGEARSRPHFQINALLLPDALDNVALGIASARRRLGGWRPANAIAISGESLELLSRRALPRTRSGGARLPYGKQRLVEIGSRWAEPPYCCSTSRGRGAFGRVRAHPAGARRAAQGHRDPHHRARHGPGVPLRQADQVCAGACLVEGAPNEIAAIVACTRSTRESSIMPEDSAERVSTDPYVQNQLDTYAR